MNCDYAVQKLLEKDLVVIAGRKEEAVGKPLIYTTSRTFMDYFGINSSEDLPKIKEVLDLEILEATKMSDESNEENNVLELPFDETIIDIKIEESSGEEISPVSNNDFPQENIS